MYFNGTGDVKKFVEKIELLAVLKEHEGEKKAIFIASKLNGVAFDVYGRFSADDKKDPEKIKGDLLKEFSCEERNREAALHSLMTSIRIKDESAQAFAYQILRLVQLAYATLGEATRKTIAKDYVVKGLSTNLQVALKSSATFAQMDINAVADETTRLEIAGINPFNPERKECVSVVEASIEDEVIAKITGKVAERLHIPSNPVENEKINFVGNNQPGYRGNRGRSNYRGRYNGGRSRSTGQNGRRCRSCQSPSHLFRNCPVRHCQACGAKGHDAWSPTCRNYS